MFNAAPGSADRKSTIFDNHVDGRPARLRMATDITRIKDLEREQDQIERALRQSQKMEAIATLAGGIAHDFNNILMAIMGYTELSLTHVQEDSRLRSCLRGVMNGAQRARDLVKQILTFSRRGETQRQPIQLDIPVKEALKLLRSTLPSDIRMVQDVASTGLVLADPTQIFHLAPEIGFQADGSRQWVVSDSPPLVAVGVAQMRPIARS